MTTYFAKHLFDGQDWHKDCCIKTGPDGLIKTFVADTAAPPADAVCLHGYVLPMMANVHSHAFQRAMAGRAEKITGGQSDSFWTWRNMMYDFAGRLTPDDVYNIARFLYSEMIAAGYNWVGEFHYLHHGADGTPYDNPFAMSDALIAAADDTGVGMTILPALYSYSGFGETAPSDGQKRFIHDEERYSRLIDHCLKQAATRPQLEVGLCFHSLRATSAAQRSSLTAAYPDLPVHIHVAEQVKEVEDCLAATGLRPVEYLYETADVNKKWTLIHATHLTDDETKMIAESGTIAGLCPTTEANLGDGLFPLQRYLAEGGSFAIGSDSHISVNWIEELRWLEYGQRLMTRARSISADTDHPSPARRLFGGALAGGAQSMNAPIGRIAEGARADFMVLDENAPCFFGLDDNMDDMLDALLFAAASPYQRPASIYLGGQPYTAPHTDIQSAYQKTLAHLFR